MVAVQLIETPNIISLQTEINKFLEAIDRSDLIDTKLTSPQKDSIAPPQNMRLYEPKPKMDSKEP